MCHILWNCRITVIDVAENIIALKVSRRLCVLHWTRFGEKQLPDTFWGYEIGEM